MTVWSKRSDFERLWLFPNSFVSVQQGNPEMKKSLVLATLIAAADAASAAGAAAGAAATAATAAADAASAAAKK